MGSPTNTLITAPASGSTATAVRPIRSMICPVTSAPIVPPSEDTDVVKAACIAVGPMSCISTGIQLCMKNTATELKI
jgi:hypothetical protein